MQVIHDASNKSTARSNIFTLDTSSIMWIENRHLQQLLAEPLCDPQVGQPGTLCQPEHVTSNNARLNSPNLEGVILNFIVFLPLTLTCIISFFLSLSSASGKENMLWHRRTRSNHTCKTGFDKSVRFSKLTWNFGFGIFESRSMR